MDWGLVIVGELHSTVSPLNTNVPLVAGVVDHDMLSIVALALAGGATIA